MLEMKDLSPKYTDHVCYKAEWNQAYKLSSLKHSFNIFFLGSKHIGDEIQAVKRIRGMLEAE